MELAAAMIVVEARPSGSSRGSSHAGKLVEAHIVGLSSHGHDSSLVRAQKSPREAGWFQGFMLANQITKGRAIKAAMITA